MCRARPSIPALVRATLGLQSSEWTGRGIGVAVVDSGLEMSSEFRGRVTAFYDFTKGGVDTVPAYDDYGHGTHVGGPHRRLGRAVVQQREQGPGAERALHRFSRCSTRTAPATPATSSARSTSRWRSARELGIHIINLSLGHPICEPAASDPLVQAVERAVRAGIIVVAAAGNMGMNPTTGKPGYAGITSPGNAPSAITVGAARTNDTVARGDDRIPDYSSAGPTWYDAIVKPDLLAPGHNLVGGRGQAGHDLQRVSASCVTPTATTSA